MRWRGVFFVCFVLTACARRDAPALHVAAKEPEVAPRPFSPAALRLRQHLRLLFLRCDEVYAELSRKVKKSRRRERLFSAGAGLLDGDTQTPEQAAALPSGVYTVPHPRMDLDSPMSQRNVAMRLSAEDHIRALNRAVDALEEHLSQHPDPDEWSNDVAHAWAEKEATLQSLCEA